MKPLDFNHLFEQLHQDNKQKKPQITVRMPTEDINKLNELTTKLNVSRNRLFSLLIQLAYHDFSSFSKLATAIQVRKEQDISRIPVRLPPSDHQMIEWMSDKLNLSQNDLIIHLTRLAHNAYQLYEKN
ncbi:hypothetical protein [Desmospora activa]|uniref:Uncharacterized protein n=1 Tax=Desmospora activa DSM 45169 TaxID=1121389 RepID=A0A2T4YZ66_9BACL|nr:hypothetical protein [Desmospora activa]PTM52199.1 hypothetical protein C8J48_3746 [Desmospora activa DSM 45169]